MVVSFVIYKQYLVRLPPRLKLMSQTLSAQKFQHLKKAFGGQGRGQSGCFKSLFLLFILQHRVKAKMCHEGNIWLLSLSLSYIHICNVKEQPTFPPPTSDDSPSFSSPLQ